VVFIARADARDSVERKRVRGRKGAERDETHWLLEGQYHCLRGRASGASC
jgi:hypothetical protein